MCAVEIEMSFCVKNQQDLEEEEEEEETETGTVAGVSSLQ